MRRAVEANGAIFHDFRPVREGVVAAVIEPSLGGLDGYVYVFGDSPPDLTKRQSILGFDEFDTKHATTVTLEGLDGLPTVTAIQAGTYLSYDSENKENRIDFLRKDCDYLISDLERIRL